MSPRWKWFLPGYLWAAPLTLFGLLLGLIYYRPTRWRWHEGCVEAVLPVHRHLIGGRWVAAQTFGNVVFFNEEYFFKSPDLSVHERVHVVQGMLGGVLFAAAYGIHYAWNRITEPHYEAYLKIFAERQAYRIQGEFIKKRRPSAWGSNR